VRKQNIAGSVLYKYNGSEAYMQLQLTLYRLLTAPEDRENEYPIIMTRRISTSK